MNDLSAFISEKRAELNLSQRQLAKLAGLNNSTIHKLENSALNRTPNISTIEALSKVFDVDIKFLLALSKNQKFEKEENNNYLVKDMQNEFVELPYFPFGVGCGNGKIAYDNFVEKIIINKTESKGADFIVRASGNSMINSGIINDSKLLVRIQPIVDRNGDIMIISNAHEGTICRQVFYVHSGYKLVAANDNKEKYPDLIINNDEWYIAGKVVRIITDL